jgi:hypothetical protein
MAESPAINLPSPEACVICLSRLSEKAIALPCKHDQFDFGCLCTWLHQQRVCPLCKGAVTAVKYDLLKPDGGSIFTLPPPELSSPRKNSVGTYRRTHPYQPRYDSYGHPFGSSHERPHHDSHGRPVDSSIAPALPRTRFLRGFRLNVEALEADKAIAFRRRVYRKQMYSLRVGSNRISRYQNLTPESFKSNDLLVSRAKTWIRRELSAFKFLDPDSPSYGQPDRRASNAEFLLEYVVSILKSIDLRGSGGQAEEMLKDFLEQENAKLFLHELEAFLRSPYETLAHWDAHVQYAKLQDSRGRRKERYDSSDDYSSDTDTSIS